VSRVEKLLFSVWNSAAGFTQYDVTYAPDYTLWDAFLLTVEASQNREYPIEREYMGQAIRWSFAFGAEDQMVERLDEDCTIQELGLQPGDIVTVSPIEYLGAEDAVARIRKDRKQLIQFMDQNAGAIKLLKANPRSFYIRLIGIKGITGVDKSGQPVISEQHDFVIHLGNPHPHEEPLVAPVSSVFHPNVSMEKRKMCVWVDYNLDQNFLLPLVCYQVADLIQYHKVNLQEPHRLMNEEASDWYEGFVENNPKFFPLSQRTFRWSDPEK